MVGFKRLLRRLGLEGMDAPENRVVAAFALALAGTAVLIRFFFWWYTGRVWEDALITVQHSENFALGLGLTHHQPPLHGFTSPLSVLVPLMGDLVKVGFGLPFIKIVSAFAAGLTILYIAAISIHPKIKLETPLAVLAMGYAAIEHHQILWGMSGMETQMVTLVLMMTFYYAIAEKPVALGISLGLCMLARPDFAFLTMIIAAYVLVVPSASPGSIRQRGGTLVKIVAVAGVVYGPWILFTTLYYGSPVPNTILAKGLGYTLWTHNPNLDWDRFWRGFMMRVSPVVPASIFQPLGPAFGGHGLKFRQLLPDHGAIVYAVLAFNAVAVVSVFRRRQWAWLPILFFILVYSLYYIFLVPAVFGWYIIPLAAAMVLLAARGIEGLFDAVRTRRGRSVALGGIAAAYLACFAVFLPKTFSTEKRIEEYIEKPVRESIGKYLGRVMTERETVGCEPLGYIGYYSRRTVFDWPGLTNRDVVEYNRTHPEGRSLTSMLAYFKPDFIVLRYTEYACSYRAAWLDSDYRIVASFEVAREKARAIFRIEDNIDTGFFVLARKDRPHPNLEAQRSKFEIQSQRGTVNVEREIPLGVNPNHSRAWFYLGVRASQQGHGDEAVDDYKKSLGIDPDFADAHAALGMALVGLGRGAEAVRHLEKAHELAPRNADTLNSIGLAMLQLGRLDEAEAQFRLAIGIDPQSANAYNNLGVAQLQQKKIEEAAASFKKAVQLDPTYPEGLKNCGGLYAARGDFVHAIEMLKRGVEADPDDPVMRQMLELAKQKSEE